MTLIRDQQLYCKEKLDAGHSYGFIGLSALLASSFKNQEIIHLLLERSRMTLNFFEI